MSVREDIQSVQELVLSQDSQPVQIDQCVKSQEKPTELIIVIKFPYFFSDAALEIVIFSTKNSTVNNSSVLKVFRQNFVLQLLTNYAALFPASFA